MEGGSPAGIVLRDGGYAGKMFYLLTNPEPLSGQAGQTVKIEGRIYPQFLSIDVDSISVRNGNQWREVSLTGVRHQPEQEECNESP